MGNIPLTQDRADQLGFDGISRTAILINCGSVPVCIALIQNYNNEEENRIKIGDRSGMSRIKIPETAKWMLELL